MLFLIKEIHFLSKMKIFLGSDHGGFELKEHIKKYLINKNYAVEDVGCHDKSSCDYPDIAHDVCNKFIRNGWEDKIGILICGTGVGMAMSANKCTRVIRCAVCNDLYTTRMTREHNDSNFLAMGARIISPHLAEEIVDMFLNTEFSGGERHKRRIDKL